MAHNQLKVLAGKKEGNKTLQLQFVRETPTEAEASRPTSSTITPLKSRKIETPSPSGSPGSPPSKDFQTSQNQFKIRLGPQLFPDPILSFQQSKAPTTTVHQIARCSLRVSTPLVLVTKSRPRNGSCQETKLLSFLQEQGCSGCVQMYASWVSSCGAQYVMIQERLVESDPDQGYPTPQNPPTLCLGRNLACNVYWHFVEMPCR